VGWDEIRERKKKSRVEHCRFGHKNRCKVDKGANSGWTNGVGVKKSSGIKCCTVAERKGRKKERKIVRKLQVDVSNSMAQPCFL
jgi:hypothetical protein